MLTSGRFASTLNFHPLVGQWQICHVARQIWQGGYGHIMIVGGGRYPTGPAHTVRYGGGVVVAEVEGVGLDDPVHLT